MKERGLMFKAEMVRAILAGTKTQTRRVPRAVDLENIRFMGCEEDPDGGKDRESDAVIRFSEDGHGGAGWYVSCGEYPEEGSVFMRCPFGMVGDRLWVKETWAVRDCGARVNFTGSERPPVERIQYIATDKAPGTNANGEPVWWNKRSAMFMPRWASRITLEIAEVRVQRLQDISPEDCIAEGIDPAPHRCGCEFCSHTSQICTATGSSLVMAYADLWRSINGPGSWEANPWVFPISFRVLPKATP